MNGRGLQGVIDFNQKTKTSFIHYHYSEYIQLETERRMKF